MCGIAGFLARDPSAPADRPGVLRMMDALVHRGPDAAGTWANGPCALGHRRLSIIDLSPEATQPLLNETGDIAVVVNGEIYNFEELRRDLLARGHVFCSRSDSETALHLYEEHGDDFAARLDGMFAILVYDARHRRLVAARDRSGKKPLFYRVLDHGVAFASEVGALLRAFPGAKADLSAIDEYLTLQYVRAPRTAVTDVFKVEAAHVATFEPGAPPVTRRYWAKPGGLLAGSPRELEDEVLRLLRAAVRKRLVADVPVGAFLSGGLDSSLVVALMAEARTAPVDTFSIGFPDADDSELGYARLVARRFGTRHHEAIVRPEMAATIVETVRHHGQPFGDSSAIATYHLAKMTRAHVTVALSGDGSDECFAGYKRYTTARLGQLYDRLPPPAKRLGNGVLRRLGSALPLPEGERYERTIGQLGPADKRALYAERMVRASAPGVPSFDEILRASPSSTAMGRVCDLDFATYLEGDINPKVDVASMAHSLEVRCPFLDTAVVEMASRLPAGMLMRVRGKALLRSATRSLLPVRTRLRIKRGFALPLARWMRRDLRAMTHDLLLDRRARERGLFQPRAVERLVARMEAGRASADHVWTLLVLEVWLREFGL